MIWSKTSLPSLRILMMFRLLVEADNSVNLVNIKTFSYDVDN